MTSTATPSKIARAVAASLWPDVQHQRKLCRGAFAFSCAGHGGIVALIDELPDVAPDAVAAARACGLLALAAHVQQGRRSRIYCTAAGYSGDELRRMAEAYPHAVSLHDVWIGEEDCDWATLALVSDAVREGMSARGYSSPITREEAYGTVQRWNERFLVALYPGAYEPLPDGQIATQDTLHAILETGGVTLRAAWGDWETGVPPGHVRVLFSGKDGREESYLMAAETYDARTTFPAIFRHSATPAMFAEIGEITLEVRD